jgi:hypothetical protein
MKKILALTVLLLPAAAAAQGGAKGGPMDYTEKGYFSVAVPAGWTRADQAFGLSQEEKKVYGADFLGAKDKDGIISKISVRYYAPGNLLHKTPERFINTHAKPVLGAAADGRKYGPVTKGMAGKYYAKVFERKTFEFIPPEAIKQKKIPVYEKYAVVPVKNGFYVLSYYASMELAKDGARDYDAVVASFKPLAK